MKVIVVIALFITLCGCATPYQSLKDSIALGGYEEEDRGNNNWVIQFHGNGYTDKSTVRKYAFRRAAELTIEHGFEWFAVLDEDYVAAYGFMAGMEMPRTILKIKLLVSKPSKNEIKDGKAYIAKTMLSN